MSVKDAWHTRPQLFFKCLLRPLNGRLPNNPWMRGNNDIEAHLVFSAPLRSSSYLPLGPWIMPPPSCMSHPPILYVGPCDLMLGRVPLFPLFLKGILVATPTIPQEL